MRRAGGLAARAASAATLLLASLALSACGASPAPLGPAGTDGLVIPTPSADPTDFSTTASNVWFPLARGTHWLYRQYTPGGNRRVDARVLPGTRRIDGVSTTGVAWTVQVGGRTRVSMTRWYGVDRSGNVWWFGQRIGLGPRLDTLAPRSWLAGRRGAEAGVVLTAHPRDGDGYLNARAPRVVERRSTVTSLDGTVGTTTKTYRHVVVTADRSTLAPLDDVQSFYARGIGLVAQQDVTSTSTSLSLVRVTRG
jgi:hypothetical protein